MKDKTGIIVKLGPEVLALLFRNHWKGDVK